MDKTRKNTLKIVLASKEKVPLHLDVLRFAATVLKIPAPDVHSIYRDENDRCFYIKFIDEPTFNDFTGQMDDQYVITHNDGEKTKVTLEVASRLFRYVRIFNLPPELEDKDIAAVLTQFGTIRQHVRERYPTDYGYAVFSGIRGVHMEIAKELPPNLFIGHFKARLYYEGLKNRCFHCKQEGHIKANCPNATNATTPKNPDGPSSYSSIVSGARKNNTPVSPLVPKMTVLNPKTKETLPDDLTRQISPTPIRPNASTVDDKIEDEDDGNRMENDEDISTEEADGDDDPNSTESSNTVGDQQRRTRGSVPRKADSVLTELDKRSRSRSFIRVNGKGGSKGGKGSKGGSK